MLFFHSDMAPHVFSCLLHMRSSRAVRDFGDKGHVINFFFIFYPKVSREMDTLKHTETSDNYQILSTPPEVPVGNLNVIK